MARLGSISIAIGGTLSTNILSPSLSPSPILSRAHTNRLSRRAKGFCGNASSRTRQFLISYYADMRFENHCVTQSTVGTTDLPQHGAVLAHPPTRP